ncbi:hypothetical protein FCV25MIE_08109 [Fagus crenata]
MEVKYAKGGTYPLALFVMLMLLLNAYCCDATVLVKSNTTVRCDGRLDECLIEDDLELELVINPYISRMLYDEPACTACSKDKNSACSGPCSEPGCRKRNSYDRTCNDD